jgi:hypothetical protein
MVGDSPMKTMMKVVFELAARAVATAVAICILLVVCATTAMASKSAYGQSDTVCTDVSFGTVSAISCTDTGSSFSINHGQELMENSYHIWSSSFKNNVDHTNLRFSAFGGLTEDVYFYDWTSQSYDQYGGSYNFDGGYILYQNIQTEKISGTNTITIDSAVCFADSTQECVSFQGSGKSQEIDSWTSKSSTFDIFGNLLGESSSSGWFMNPVSTWKDSYKYSLGLYPSFGNEGLTLSSMSVAADTADAPEPGTVGMVLFGGLVTLIVRKRIRRT